jgi:phosphate starvation-inducible PhoH-like protein
MTLAPRKRNGLSAKGGAAGSQGATSVREFSDNSLVQLLFGPHNSHLEKIERQLGVTLSGRGNAVAITGHGPSVEEAGQVLDTLYALAKRQGHVESADVESALKMVSHAMIAKPGDVSAGGIGGGEVSGGPMLRTRKRHIGPRTPGQAGYLDALDTHELVFGLGPAGTGKTYLAVAKAVSLMLQGDIDRIILSRPAVEAGERLGFLPGDLKEKIDPYLRPLYDALHDMLPGDQVMKKLASGEIEVAPLAFMRGRTLANSFIILDEAQNTTPVQMKMFLTRMGEHSRMVITGDMSQVDLPTGMRSGLADAVDTLRGVPGVAFVALTDKDVVRHGLVTEIVRAYDAQARKLAAKGDRT